MIFMASLPPVLGGVGKESQETALLEDPGELPVMVRAGSADPARHDLAAVRHEPRQPAFVAEAHLLDAIDAELAHLAAYPFLGTCHSRILPKNAGMAAASGRRLSS